MAKKRFIFDENYIKRYAKKDKTRWLVIGASVLFIILIIILILLVNRNQKPKPVAPAVTKYELKEELTIESGSYLPEVVDYFNVYENIDMQDVKVTYPENFIFNYDISACNEDDMKQIEVDYNKVNYDNFDCIKKVLSTPATYGITINVLDKEYTVRLNVIDSTSPILNLKNIEIYEGEEYSIVDFVDKCFDISGECELKYITTDVSDDGTTIDYSKYKDAGTYPVKIIAYDIYENASNIGEATLTIKKPLAPLYIVSFNTNGGSIVDNIIIEEGKTITAPKDPTRTGFTFAGWYLGTTKYDFETPINRNMTLVAKWNKVNNGGNSQGGSSQGGSSQQTEPIVENEILGVSINFLTINLMVGDSKTVVAKVSYQGNIDTSVTWTSANSSIATVKDGVITGIKSGSTVITATAGNKSSSVNVIVKDKQTTSTCTYGDASYNTDYVLSVDLRDNNCATNPNINYEQRLSIIAANDNSQVIQKLINKSYSADHINYRDDYKSVKNNSGIGLVGYQITIKVTALDSNGKLKTSTYILYENGTRKFIGNNELGL